MKMTMEQKRKAVIGGVVIGAIMILLGNAVISVAGLVLAFAALSMQYVWFRCPHCGIFIQLWHYKEDEECPQCGKKLG
ncbi:MAG: hypothetical protein E7445_03670 [Ruminococcaceae bacterium]|nr:hypothetical protein [Oscillospiraceae bacterium]